MPQFGKTSCTLTVDSMLDYEPEPKAKKSDRIVIEEDYKSYTCNGSCSVIILYSIIIVVFKICEFKTRARCNMSMQNIIHTQ